MNEDKKGHIVKFSQIKESKLLKKTNLEPIEINEMGEVSIKKGKNQRSKAPWQYRFFMSMVIFLLITILVSSWFR